MNTESKDLADQTAQDRNILKNGQAAEKLIDGGDFVLAEDEDLQLADVFGDPSDMDDGEDDIIELTEVVEGSPVGDAGLADDEADPISIDAGALEEEEIIELVDALKDDSEMEEEVLELTDVVEDDTFEVGQEPIDGATAEDKSDEDLSDEDLSGDMGMAQEEEGADMPGVEAQDLDAVPSAERQEIAMEEEISDADETVEDVELVPEAAESHEIPVDAAGSDGEKAIRERLSDERIEAIITRVVKDTIEEKADRILLEVAEAAIAKEIEKIKKAL